MAYPRRHRVFDGEKYTLYGVYGHHPTAEKEADALRKSLHYGTVFGVKARVFELPKTQRQSDYYRSDAVFKWAVYIRPYKLPEAEAQRRTEAMEQEDDRRWQEHYRKHGKKHLEDLYDNRPPLSSVVLMRLRAAYSRAGMPPDALLGKTSILTDEQAAKIMWEYHKLSSWRRRS